MTATERQIDPSTEGPPDTSVAALTELPSELALKRGIIHTDVSPGVARGMVAAFVFMIVAVPLGQVVYELARQERVQALDVFTHWPTRTTNRQYEQELEKSSAVRRGVQPYVQYGLTRWGGFGNVKATVGRDGWLFYTPGVDAVTGPGFLDPDVLYLRRKRALDEGHAEPLHPDPRPAVLQFRRDLAARGVRLVLLPVADKATVQGSQLTGRLDPRQPVSVPHNPDVARFAREMRAAGVGVSYPFPGLVGSWEEPRYLVQDTHWTPQFMDRVARGLAANIRDSGVLPPPPAPRAFAVETKPVSRVGDLVDMLQLPAGQSIFRPQAVEVQQVFAPGGGLWQPSRAADVLLLGDSFTNIYSAPEMGWGESAGFAEHLALHLGRDLDVIAVNDNGASATRQALARDLARGKDRLAGKKLVVWEFAARELAVGDWRPVELKLGAPAAPAGRFVAPEPGQTIVVSGTVESRSAVPRPGTVPYKDQVFAVHLTDLERDGTPIPGGQAVVYLRGMQDNAWTPAARLRVGQRVKLKLSNWSDVSARYERMNRSELADETLQFETPAWGEIVE
jgi:hypothetical protein